MKKLFTVLTAMGLSGFLFGQYIPNIPNLAPREETQTKDFPNVMDASANVSQNQITSSSSAPGDTVAYFDFSGGLQGWSATTVSGPATWVHSTTGSSGQYSSAAPIASTTGSNGFLKFDTDGANTPGTAASFADCNGFIESPIIDLSNEPGVVIQFQQNYRPFSAAELVMGLSSDGGATWTEIDVRFGVSSNTASANPRTDQILASQIIGGSAQAKIRFHWRASSHYIWMVDDVLILKQPATDFGLTDIYYNGSQDTARHNLFWTEIPLRHANFTEINAGAGIKNFSLAPNTNMQVTANLSHPASSSSQTVQSAAFGLSGTTSRVDTFIDIPGSLSIASGLGTYNFSLGVAADSIDLNPADNVFQETIIVTDTVYSRDKDDVSFIRQRAPGRVLANWYEFHAPDTATSITIFVGNPAGNPGSSSIGAIAKVYLLDSLLSIIEESGFYTINRTGFHTIQLQNPAVLNAGNYYAALESASDSIWIAIDADRVPPFFTTYENVGWTLGQGGNWFFANFNAVPYIRLNVRPFACPDLNPTVTVQDANCGQSDGSIEVTPTGGSAPYTYLWPNGTTNRTISGLGSGSYTVTITDSEGCSQEAIGNVGDLGAPVITQTNLVIDSCFGGNTGAVSINVTGGTGTFAIQWSTNDTGVTSLTGLSRGVYSVTVTDSLNCNSIRSFFIAGPTAPIAGTLSAIRPISCNGETDAEITVNVTGGTPPYNFLWMTGATTQLIDNVGPGAVAVTITDANNCQQSSTGNITEPQALFIGGGTPQYLNNNQTANITISPSGGRSPYTFLWTGPNGFTSSNQNLTGISVNGVYNVQMTDNSNCQTDRDILVDNIQIGVAELNGRKFINTFPNPTNGKLWLDATEVNGTYTIRVQNVLGAIVHNQEVAINNQAVEVDLSNNTKGIYFLQLLNDKGAVDYVSRIIIE